MGMVHALVELHPFRLMQICLPDRPVRLKGSNASEAAVFPELDPRQIPEADQLAEMIHAYFESRRPLQPCWQWLCLDRLTPRQQQVLFLTAEIPFGRVRTYGEIADALGKPGAARFVGNTMALNPYPLMIPCHRVIRASGDAGGFGGGTDMKKALLAHEAAGRHPVLAH